MKINGTDLHMPGAPQFPAEKWRVKIYVDSEEHTVHEFTMQEQAIQVTQMVCASGFGVPEEGSHHLDWIPPHRITRVTIDLVTSDEETVAGVA